MGGRLAVVAESPHMAFSPDANPVQHVIVRARRRAAGMICVKDKACEPVRVRIAGAGVDEAARTLRPVRFQDAIFELIEVYRRGGARGVQRGEPL